MSRNRKLRRPSSKKKKTRRGGKRNKKLLLEKKKGPRIGRVIQSAFILSFLTPIWSTGLFYSWQLMAIFSGWAMNQALNSLKDVALHYAT